MDISTKQLRAFILAYRLQNITKAAEQLCLTQAAVSALIKQLERTLQVQLFNRTSRSVTPTPFATQMMSSAEIALGELHAIQKSAKVALARSLGVVRFTASHAASGSFVPVVMREFMRRHPEVTVQLKEIAVERLVECVAKDEVDFSIGTPIQTPSDVHLEPLLTDYFAAIGRRDMPFASVKKLKWSDVANLPMMAVPAGMGIRQAIDGALSNVGISFEPMYEFKNLATMLSMAAEGIGVLISPSQSIPVAFRKVLIARKLHDPLIPRISYVVTKRADSLSIPAQAFVRAIREHLRQHPSPV
jgi:DNA-binding transcriptional LysR family regulator